MKAVLIIVSLTSPSEKAYEFETQDAASVWLEEAYNSGRWEREQWLTPRIMPLSPPPEA